MTRYIREHFGASQVLHISRYFPRYRMIIPPTPLATLKILTEIAKLELEYVYQGNTGPESDSNTYCPGCNNILIKRHFYYAEVIGMQGNHCTNCGKIIYGKFSRI